MAQDSGKWWESRKVWIVGLGVLAIVAVALAGKPMGLNDEMIQAIIASIVGLVAVLTGAHAYTDVRLTSQDKHGELMQRSADNRKRETDGIFGSILEALPGIISVVDGIKDMRSAAPATAAASVPQSIETPEGEALRLRLDDVPECLPETTFSDYIKTLEDFVARRAVYALIDPGEGPVRVDNALIISTVEMLGGEATALDLRSAIVRAVLNAPIYIVPEQAGRGAEPPDMSTPEEPSDA